MMKLFILLFAVGYVQYTYALTEAEVKIQMTRHVMKCLKEYPDVSVTELTDLQKLIPPKSMKVKCLLACAYKREGSLNKDGLYDLEHAYKKAEEAKNGDEKRYENGKKFADFCTKMVNEAAVNEANKECERAGLIFKCGVENASKFGFKI